MNEMLWLRKLADRERAVPRPPALRDLSGDVLGEISVAPISSPVPLWPGAVAIAIGLVCSALAWHKYNADDPLAGISPSFNLSPVSIVE